MDLVVCGSEGFLQVFHSLTALHVLLQGFMNACVFSLFGPCLHVCKVRITSGGCQVYLWPRFPCMRHLDESFGISNKHPVRKSVISVCTSRVVAQGNLVHSGEEMKSTASFGFGTESFWASLMRFPEIQDLRLRIFISGDSVRCRKCVAPCWANAHKV